MKSLKWGITCLLFCFAGMNTCFSQVFDLGLGIFMADQRGVIIEQGQRISKTGTYILPVGKLDIYKPLFLSKTQNFSFGIETGMAYTYTQDREIRTYDNSYKLLLADQNFFSRSFGALQIPLQLSLRSGRFSSPLENNRRSLGISGGAQLITFYMPDERGTMIAPSFSIHFGILRYMVLHAEFIVRSYTSEYATTMQPIARLQNKFNTITLSYTLK